MTIAITKARNNGLHLYTTKNQQLVNNCNDTTNDGLYNQYLIMVHITNDGLAQLLITHTLETNDAMSKKQHHSDWVIEIS